MTMQTHCPPRRPSTASRGRCQWLSATSRLVSRIVSSDLGLAALMETWHDDHDCPDLVAVASVPHVTTMLHVRERQSSRQVSIRITVEHAYLRQFT